MIRVFPFNKLGNHNYGWLDAHYHFSFANYYDSKRCGFPPLLVWNDDLIQPGTGFPMHSHKDMEIITYIRQGTITHEDSLGIKGITRAGEIQIMSAGTGITHSEYNHEDDETLLFQIWIQPETNNIKPRWENVDLHANTKNGIRVLASGQKEKINDGIVTILQDASLYSITGYKGYSEYYSLSDKRHIYLVVSKGEVCINNIMVGNRDGVFIQDEKEIEFILQGESEVILLDLPNL